MRQLSGTCAGSVVCSPALCGEMRWKREHVSPAAAEPSQTPPAQKGELPASPAKASNSEQRSQKNTAPTMLAPLFMASDELVGREREGFGVLGFLCVEMAEGRDIALYVGGYEGETQDGTS